MSDIPVGYQLHITTWENDGDARTTQIFSGLAEQDVKFMVHIVKQFRSRNRGGHGNKYAEPGVLPAVISGALEAFPGVSSELKEQWAEGAQDDDIAYDLICELLNYPQDEFYRAEQPYFCRVFESYKAFNIKEPVKDVTTEF